MSSHNFRFQPNSDARSDWPEKLELETHCLKAAIHKRPKLAHCSSPARFGQRLHLTLSSNRRQVDAE